MQRNTLILFIRLIRPFFLLGGVLLYALGVGIAYYLGVTIDWQAYWMGQVCVTTLQLSAQLLNEYFDGEADQQNSNRSFLTGGSGALGEDGLPRRTALLAAFATLTVLAFFIFLLYLNRYIHVQLLVLAGIATILAIFYSVPPLRLVSTGYGELTTSFLVASLVPAFGFLLQGNELHRLLALSTFPLLFLHLAMMLAFELPDYLTDIQHGKRTLLARVGWQRGMWLHNLSIVLAYILLGAALFEGLPWRITWPVLVTLPLGIFQIWQINQIALGAKPRWPLLTGTGLALFAVVAYLLAFGFWFG